MMSLSKMSFTNKARIILYTALAIGLLLMVVSM